MTVRDVLNTINTQGPIVIYYRRVVEIENIPSGKIEKIDIFAGICRYENGTLLSLDGDSYSLDDKICKYEEKTSEDGGKKLTVWYE